MIKKLEKTFDEITFVTMCVDMGMDRLKGVKGNNRGTYEEYYVRNLLELSRLFRSIVAFCDKKCSDVLEPIVNEESLKVVIIPMELKELPMNIYLEQFKDVLPYMRKTTTRPIISWYNSRHPSTIIKKGMSDDARAQYNSMQNSKIDLMKWTVEQNPFQTNYFYWIDAGTIHPNYNMCWEGWDGNITQRPTKFRGCIDWKSRDQLIHRPRTRKAVAHDWDQAGHVVGLSYGGTGGCIMTMHDLWHQTIEDFLKHHVLGPDMAILTWIFQKHPEFFELADAQGYTGVAQAIFNGEAR